MEVIGEQGSESHGRPEGNNPVGVEPSDPGVVGCQGQARNPEGKPGLEGIIVDTKDNKE